MVKRNSNPPHWLSNAMPDDDSDDDGMPLAQILAQKQPATDSQKSSSSAAPAPKSAPPPVNKRAPTGYLLFCADQRPNVNALLEARLAVGDKLSPQSTVMELAAQWNKLPDKERAEWNALAAASAEVRIAPDGFAYTKKEFVEFFGSTQEWDQAVPRKAASDADKAAVPPRAPNAPAPSPLPNGAKDPTADVAPLSSKRKAEEPPESAKKPKATDATANKEVAATKRSGSSGTLSTSYGLVRHQPIPRLLLHQRRRHCRRCRSRHLVLSTCRFGNGSRPSILYSAICTAVRSTKRATITSHSSTAMTTCSTRQ